MSSQKRFVIGIDGGGTKTHAILVDLEGNVVKEAFAGPCHLLKIGIEASAQVLFDAVAEICRLAECSPEQVQRIVIGVAGGGRAIDRTVVADHLVQLGVKKKFPLKNIVVETDAQIALEAAFAGGPGIILIGGTGSIALYRTEDNKILRAGGWGSIIGDEGSGFAIGRDGLNAVFRQHDGRSEKTLLTKKALQFYGVAQVEHLVTKIYHEKADVASFAPQVFEAVNERDRVAHGVLVKNSNDLAELVRVLIMQVRPKRKLPICLMGGMLESENVYAKMVKEKIIHALPHVLVQKPKFSSAFGAAIIGLNAFR